MSHNDFVKYFVSVFVLTFLNSACRAVGGFPLCKKGLLYYMNKKSTPLISIAMTTCNGGKFLVDQLESILNQSYDNLELIICDDVSDDGTIAIIKRFQKGDSRITLHENSERLGIVKNFEKAIGFCKGEYIALSDQDDVWLKHKIRVLLDNIEDNLLIHSDAILIDADGSSFSDSYTAYSKKVIYPKTLIDVVLNGYVTGCTAMFSRNLLQDILPFPEKIFIHDKWICSVAFLMGKVAYVAESLVQYRQHGENSIGAEKIEQVSFVNKISKIHKNRNYYRNHSLFKSQMRKQLEFTEIIYAKSSNKLTASLRRKLRFLCSYFRNAASDSIKLKAFLIRTLMFNHFDRNRSLKIKLFDWLKILFM